MDSFYYLLTPFTWLLQFFYNITGSYGFALIFFAVVAKLILFPFSLKGKKSMIQMNLLSGKMQQIQKKYASDKERQNLEVQKMYEREKVNPMGGCLWSFLPVMILLPLYAIIRQPLKYMMGLTVDQINAVANAVNWSTVAVEKGWVKGAAQAASFSSAGYNQLFLSSLIKSENLETVKAAVGEGASKIFSINFNFLGLDLSQVPNMKFWVNGVSLAAFGLFLIPVISAITGLVFSYISMKTNKMGNQEISKQQKTSNRTMMFISPVMSLWIGFIMPAGLGVYWVANNLLSILQEYVSGRILKKDYEAVVAAKAEQERLDKEEEKQRRREAMERKAQAIAEAKKNKGRKKAEAAEKKKSDASVISVSSVGIRAYARGRAYDPFRFSPDGPTAYKNPGAPIDEVAVEEAAQKKADHAEKETPIQDSSEVTREELREEADEMDSAESSSVPESSASEAVETQSDIEDSDPWAAIDEEIKEIQDSEKKD